MAKVWFEHADGKLYDHAGVCKDDWDKEQAALAEGIDLKAKAEAEAKEKELEALKAKLRAEIEAELKASPSSAAPK